MINVNNLIKKTEVCEEEKLFEDSLSSDSLEGNDDPLFAGYCFLRTKSKKFKKFWLIVIRNHVFFFKKKEESKHSLMHSLVGTFSLL